MNIPVYDDFRIVLVFHPQLPLPPLQLEIYRLALLKSYLKQFYSNLTPGGCNLTLVTNEKKPLKHPGVYILVPLLDRPRTKFEENQTFTLTTKCLGNFNTVGVGCRKVGKNQKHTFRRSEDSKYLLFSNKQNEGRDRI